MNPESEDFDALRRLLALKRYEQPPPGYFNRFPRDVMARIKAGEHGGAIGLESSWLQRLLSVFDVKPVFAGAFGTVVCAFVISGVISSERAPAVGAEAPSSASPSMAVAMPGDMSSSEVSTAPAEARLVAASTNSGSLFDQFTLQPQQVSDRLYFPNN
jgi:hypothetical protein